MSTKRRPVSAKRAAAIAAAAELLAGRRFARRLYGTIAILAVLAGGLTVANLSKLPHPNSTSVLARSATPAAFALSPAARPRLFPCQAWGQWPTFTRQDPSTSLVSPSPLLRAHASTGNHSPCTTSTIRPRLHGPSRGSTVRSRPPTGALSRGRHLGGADRRPVNVPH